MTMNHERSDELLELGGCPECGHDQVHQSDGGCVEVLLLVGQRHRGTVLCGCTNINSGRIAPTWWRK